MAKFKPPHEPSAIERVEQQITAVYRLQAEGMANKAEAWQAIDRLLDERNQLTAREAGRLALTELPADEPTTGS